MLRIFALNGLLCFVSVYAQPPDTLWSRTWDFDGAADFAMGVSETADGGYVFPVTHAFVNPGYGSVIKVDSQGELMWATTMHTEYNFNLWDLTVQENGNFGVLGSEWGTGIPEPFGRFMLVILSPNGDSLTTFFIGELDSNYTGYALDACVDGGYILAGMTSRNSGSAGRLAKVDSLGHLEWERMLGVPTYTPLFDVQQTYDHGYVVAGNGEDSLGTGNQIWAVKLTEMGDVEWEYMFGDLLMNDEGYAIAQTADGGYLLGGSSYLGPQLTCYDFTIIRLNSSGEELWENTFNWSNDPEMCDWEIIHSIYELPNGNIIAIGSSEAYHDGVGGTVVIGLDSGGDLLWRQLYAVSSNTWGGMVASTGYVVTAGWLPITGSLDAQLMKLDRVFEPSSIGKYTPLPTTFQVSAYPNPFNPSTSVNFELPVVSHVRIEAFNSLGQQVSLLTDRVMPAGKHAVTFSGSTLTSGEYFVKVNAGANSTVVKTVLLK